MHWSGLLSGLLGKIYGRMAGSYMETEAATFAARAEE